MRIARSLIVIGSLICMTEAVLGQALSQPGSAKHATTHRHSVYANGRCNGVSYGTGARRCGTATGGPVGGLSSRN